MTDDNFVPPYEIVQGAQENRNDGTHNHPENWSTPPTDDTAQGDGDDES